MKKYITELNRIDAIESKHSKARGGEVLTNRTMRKFLSAKRSEAGAAFLEQIKSECKGIGATQDELDEEQRLLNEEMATEKAIKPPLTKEYLISIGRADLTSW